MFEECPDPHLRVFDVILPGRVIVLPGIAPAEAGQPPFTCDCHHFSEGGFNRPD